MSACSTYPRGHGGRPHDVQVGDTEPFTSFSFNGEHIPNTFSERRGCLLRASSRILMYGTPQGEGGE